MVDSQSVRKSSASISSANIDAGLRAHMNKVYALMSIGLFLTGGVAYIVGNNETLVMSLFTGMSRWVVMFAPLVVVFAMGSMINRLRASTAQLIFYAFSALMGLSISYIFMIYTSVSIAQTFLVTSIAFAGLSLYGYTTKRNISGMGSFLIMGVIGLIVASIVNIWMQSPALMYAISVIGVLIFAGLTAYDTQKIKNTYIQMAQNGQNEWIEKSAIMGALSLYLDFLNMFMFLLHLFGNRN
ncbi:MAG: Bax inhibitor-1/YccA family protein [Paracoccaceae bacterium]|jgi:FtsH-binding integral membrane protein|nr:Bax inhibitor-1/YccA family protein [Paracoccaceae bacterium]MDC1255628.1 Bax inhibitor-1/YccA family protein [Paracoccaceae bacterium]MDE2693892.1 Bax inhibitor-1/YccA family protein [Paracoccaceae bacterium]